MLARTLNAPNVKTMSAAAIKAEMEAASKRTAEILEETDELLLKMKMVEEATRSPFTAPPIEIAFGNRCVLSNSPIGAYILKERAFLLNEESKPDYDSRHEAVRCGMAERALAFAAALKNGDPNSNQLAGLIVRAILYSMGIETELEPPKADVQEVPKAKEQERRADPLPERKVSKPAIKSSKASVGKQILQIAWILLSIPVGLPLLVGGACLWVVAGWWALEALIGLPAVIMEQSFTHVLGYVMAAGIRCGSALAAIYGINWLFKMAEKFQDAYISDH